MEEFNKLLENIRELIESGVSEINAIEYVTKLREEYLVFENIHNYLFGDKNEEGKPLQ